MLIVSDLHLTDNPKDEYRWGLFPWIKRMRDGGGPFHPLNTLLILGDLTDAKDNHSARLVNRLVHSLTDLSVNNVYVLKGNHDYSLSEWPFFKFLRHFPGFHYIDGPTRVGREVLFLPHTRNPKGDWEGIRFSDFSYVFMHQTVSGALASNGERMREGVSSEMLNTPGARTKIFSGDIHVPQIIGDVEYVGSPYPVHFGDSFRGRAVMVEKDGSRRDFYYTDFRKSTITVRSAEEVGEAQVREGDQVKIRVDLPRSQRSEWHRVREEVIERVRSLGGVVCGVELIAAPMRRLLMEDAERISSALATKGPEAALRRFAAVQKVDEPTLLAGIDLVKGVGR